MKPGALRYILPALALAVFTLANGYTTGPGQDGACYVRAFERSQAGGPIYLPPGGPSLSACYVYPPTFAHAGASALEGLGATGTWWAMLAAILAGSVYLIGRSLEAARLSPLWALAACLALAEPVASGVEFGNVAPAISGLLLAALLARPWWVAALALAAGLLVKPVALAALPVLILERRTRRVGLAGAGALGLAVILDPRGFLGWIHASGEKAMDWSGATFNLAPLSVLANLGLTIPGSLWVAMMGAGATAWWWTGRSSRPWRVTASGLMLWCLASSPAVWDYTLTLAIPALLIAGGRLERRLRRAGPRPQLGALARGALAGALALGLVAAPSADAAPGDPLFRGDFESGNTSAWSATVPEPRPTWPVPFPAEVELTVSAYSRLMAGGDGPGAVERFRAVTTADFDAYVAAGIDGEELWVNGGFWPEAFHLMKADGSRRSSAERRFQIALELAEERGLWLSIRASCGSDVSQAALVKFWTELGPSLEGHHVLVDLCNEADPGKRSAAQTALLASRFYDAAPGVPYTISAGLNFLQAVGTEWARIRGPRGPPAPVHYLTPHGPRGAPPPVWSPGGEGPHTAAAVAAGAPLGLPYYGHEPHRRGYFHSGHPWPDADEFKAALQAARRAGAGAWCFHNGAKCRDWDSCDDLGSFDMTNGLLPTLDAVERNVLANMARWWRNARAAESDRIPRAVLPATPAAPVPWSELPQLPPDPPNHLPGRSATP